MNQSFLILGREKCVAFAEIYQYIGKSDDIIADFGEDGVIISDADFGSKSSVILGSIPKSGHLIDKISKIDADVLAVILSKFIINGQKFHFGLSVYPPSRSVAIALERRRLKLHGASGDSKMSQVKLKALGLEIKKILKNQGLSVRLVESRSGNLSSVDVVKNKLLPPKGWPASGWDKGVELCLLFLDDGSVAVGKTESVQPYESYSERDFGRPARDMKRGMIPPKLARSMVNMSGAQSGALILDPFCGIGTILQEALLLGYRVIGTDIEEQAILDTRKNIEWLFETYEQDFPEPKIDAMDVRALDRTLTEKSVDAIVSEFDLGPSLSGGEDLAKIESIERSLSEFYSDALSMMRYVLKDNARAVVAWPYFIEQGIMVSAFDKLSSLGWRMVEPYPAKYQKTYPLSERGTLLYGRPGQHVFREILILEKSPHR